MTVLEKSLITDAELTIGLRQAAHEAGIDLTDALRHVGWGKRILDHPEGYVSWVKWSKLLEFVAQEHNCQYFGLLIADHQPAIQLGLMGQIMRLCPDIGTAIAKAQEYGTTYSHTVYWETHFHGGFITLNRKLYHKLDGLSGQCSTLSIAQAYKAIAALYGSSWLPTEVKFVHKRPSSSVVRRYRDFFKVPVMFGQMQDSLTFPAVDFEQAIQTSNPQLLPIIESHAKEVQSQLNIEHSLFDKVRFLIRENLGQGCDIHLISGILSIHPKTLHRRLGKDNLTFKQLLKEERDKLAVFYLTQSEIRLSELAETLGYSEASAMSRAFKQIHGISPNEFRKAKSPDN